MLGQVYLLNVRSIRILLRSTLLPNVACVVNVCIETAILNASLYELLRTPMPQISVLSN